MKSTLKKSIAILLFLCLCLSLFPAVYAEENESGDELLTEEIVSDGWTTVSGQAPEVLDETLSTNSEELTGEEFIISTEYDTLYEEVPGEAELPDEMTDTVLETPDEESPYVDLETVFAGISIPQIEQNVILESTTHQTKMTAAENFGAGLYSVCFYSEKSYDLIGLVVTDGAGKVLEPAATDGGWTYVLAPGTYTYRYHDDRAIFTDIGETAFTVDGALEIALDLTAAFADDFVFSLEINPLYDDILDASALVVPDDVREETLDAVTQQRLAEAEGGRKVTLRAALTPAQQVRINLAARVEETPFSFYSDEQWGWDDLTDTFREIADEALQHTGNHWEGDTLRWTYSAYGTYHPDTLEALNIFDSEKNQYRHDFAVVFLLRTTAAQEEAVYSAVESMAAGLNGMSEYQKAFAINQWLYQNVNYDHTHENDSSYQLQFTDYAALFDRIAVCQGFSITFYRIALAAGLNARVVTSTAMKHAWNIVSIDGVWYELDATWDSNWRERGTPLSQLPHYFLRGSTWWSTGHGNGGIGDQFDPDNTKYYNPSFDAYTLSQTDYTPEEPGTYIVSYNANGGDSAPNNQTKIHGVNLTLTAEQPARTDDPTVTYSLILNGNGGTIAIPSNPAASAVECPLKREVSYSFLRWNTKANGSGTNYSPGDLYSEDASLELYARWNKKTNAQYVMLPTPTREGYYFLGWGTSADATTGITGKYTPTENATLYAVWVQPDFVLPAFLTNIEAEAFAGCAFSFVKLSENTANVGPRAFADCPNLKYIYIPAETTVDDTAFQNVEGLTVFRPAA